MLDEQINSVNKMKVKERRGLFPNAFLEYDNKGLLYYTIETPDYLLPDNTNPGDPYIVEGKHSTLWDLVKKNSQVVT